MTRYSKCWLSKPKARMIRDGGWLQPVHLALAQTLQAAAFSRESQSLLIHMKSEEAPAGFTMCSVDKIMGPLKS